MKKAVKALALACVLAFVFACGVFLAACGGNAPPGGSENPGGQTQTGGETPGGEENPGEEETPGGEENPGEEENPGDEETAQKQLDAFLAAVESDTARYDLSVAAATVVQGTRQAYDVSVVSDGERAHLRSESGGTLLQEEYARADGNYRYSYFWLNGIPAAQTGVTYDGQGAAATDGIRTVLEFLLGDLFRLEGEFWTTFRAGLRAEQGGVVFSSDAFTKGSVTLAEGRAELTLEAELPADGADDSGTAATASVRIQDLSTRTDVQLSDEAAAAFAAMGEFDRAYARFDWALGSGEAALEGTLGYADGSSGTLTAKLARGEMLLRVTSPGAVQYSAILAHGDRFCTVQGAENALIVSDDVPRGVVFSVFDFLMFTEIRKEYFILQEDGGDVLTLSQAGWGWYTHCRGLQVACGPDDVFTVTASLDGSADVGYVRSVRLTAMIAEQAEPVAFPEAITRAHGQYHAEQG